jgi:hypothetical protein
VTEHLKKRAFEKRAKKAKKKKRLGVEAFGAVLSHEQVGGSPLLPDPHDHCVRFTCCCTVGVPL